jgi:Fic family protein
LLKACIFHYELEFIHPFTDGNGRMGRLWQQLILMKENPIFESISVEEIIKENQYAYYDVLGLCDKKGDITPFIEFGLQQILNALQRFNIMMPSNIKNKEWRLSYAKQHLKDIWFTRKDYMRLHQDVSSATSSRDLTQGISEKILEKKGALNQVQYRFK